MSLLIPISDGFSILVIFPDKLAYEIDIYLFTVLNVSSVSVLWLDLDFSNDLPSSDLFLLDLSFFGYLWFLYFVDCINIVFNNGRSDGFPHHIRFCSHFSIPFFANYFGSGDQWSFGRHDIGAWSSLPGLLKNKSNFLIVKNLVSNVLVISISIQPRSQHSTRLNKSPVIKIIPPDFLITPTWSN